MLKKPSIWLFSVLSSAIFLSACQPKAPTEQANQEPAASEVVAASIRLTASNQKLNIQLPACKGNDCSEFIVERLQSNQAFVDDVIDAAILKILSETLSDAPLQVSEQAASEISVVSTQAKMEQQIQPYTQAFLTLDQELKALSAGHPISVTLRPQILQAAAPVATVVLNSSSYLGGAHGSSGQQYFNFDLNQQKQIALQDILLPKQDAVLKAKAYAAFKAWVIETELADNVTEYEQAWPFRMTNNFYLAKQGLIFQYAEYEIGPYVVGLPRLVIPYAELKGVLKPEYVTAEVQAAWAEAASEVK